MQLFQQLNYLCLSPRYPQRNYHTRESRKLTRLKRFSGTLLAITFSTSLASSCLFGESEVCVQAALKGFGLIVKNKTACGSHGKVPCTRVISWRSSHFAMMYTAGDGPDAQLTAEASKNRAVMKNMMVVEFFQFRVLQNQKSEEHLEKNSY